MEDYTLELSERERKGTSASRQLRKEGWLPAVIYSAKGECLDAKMNYKEFVRLAQRSRSSRVFTFKSESSKFDGKNAVVKEIQKEPLKGSVLHVDFQSFDEGERIRMDVPLRVEGEATGVKNDGGVLATACNAITVLGNPKSVPEIISIDISHLGIGQAVSTGDLELPEGVELVSNPLETVASVVSGRQSRVAAMEAASADDAAAGEAGDAAAAGGDQAKE